jgi:ribosomal protein L31E
MASKQKPAITGLHSQGIVDDIILPLARKGFRTIAKKGVKTASKQFAKNSPKAISTLSKSVENSTKADMLAIKQALSYKNKTAKAIGDKLSVGHKVNKKIVETSNKKIKRNTQKAIELRDKEMFSGNISSYKNINDIFKAPIKKSNMAAQSKKYRKPIQKGK